MAHASCSQVHASLPHTTAPRLSKPSPTILRYRRPPIAAAFPNAAPCFPTARAPATSRPRSRAPIVRSQLDDSNSTRGSDTDECGTFQEKSAQTRKSPSSLQKPASGGQSGHLRQSWSSGLVGWIAGSVALASVVTSASGAGFADVSRPFLGFPSVDLQESEVELVEARFGGMPLELGPGVDVEYIRPGHRPDLPFNSPLFGPKRQANEPQQVHVMLAGPGAMRVMWVTDDAAAPSVVEWGERAGEYTRTAEGSSATYRHLLYRSGTIHSVVVGGPDAPLAPNTTYHYRVGGVVGGAASVGAAGGFERSEDLSFKTPPPVGADETVNFAVVGDMGQTGWTVSTLSHIQQQPYDLLVLPGDLAYADGYQPRWDTWHNLIQPLASSRPWMTAPGNHEIEAIPGLMRPFVAYSARWDMPNEASGSPSNLFYSFEAGGVHWVMLNSYSDFEPDSPQLKWLESDLSLVDRSTTPWLLAVVHAPWYNSNTAHQQEAEPMRRAVERVLYEARTDVVFAGHVHAYERTSRVFNNRVDPCGPIHITIGDGGNKEGLATSYIHPSPDWSVFQEASFGHGELKVFGSSSAADGAAGGDADVGVAGEAEWLWHRNDDEELVVRDSVRIVSLASDEAPAQCRPPTAAAAAASGSAGSVK